MNNWKYRRIKEVGNLRLGKMLTEKPILGFHQRPYLKSKNIDWLNLRLESVEQMYFSDLELKNLRLRKNDLVISEGGEVGKTALWQDEMQECYIQNSVHKLTLNKECNPRFYLYLFYNLGHTGYFKSIVNLVSIMHLTYEKLRRIVVPVPPLEEQDRMVNYLDSKLTNMDNKVCLLTSKRDAYLRLKKSIINHAVTKGLNPEVQMKASGVDGIGEIPEHWDVKRLKDICTLSPSIKSCFQFEYASFLPMEGLRLGQIDISDEPVSTLQGKYTPFENNDLLIAKVTPCFENGNIAIAQGLTNGIGFGSSEIFVLRAKKVLNIQFLFYMALSSDFQDKACSTMCGVGGLKRISPLFMKSHTITMPPLSEQQAIAAYLDEKCSKIDKIVANLEKQISLYTDMKRSLIDEVITGKRAV